MKEKASEQGGKDRAERPGQAAVWLRRIYESLDSDGAVVFCPERGEAVEVAACRKCGACRGLFVDTTERSTFLRCASGADRMSGLLEGANPSVASADPVPGDTYEPVRFAAQSVREVMSYPVRCVTADLSLEELAALFVQHSISAAPVVDDRGECIGLVSKSDLIRRYVELPDVDTGFDFDAPFGGGVRWDELPDGPVDRSFDTVADVMTPLVFAVSEDVTVAQSAALMAYEGVHHLIVRDRDSRPVGMLSSLDVLRQLAIDEGHLLPRSSKTRRESGGD